MLPPLSARNIHIWCRLVNVSCYGAWCIVNEGYNGTMHPQSCLTLCTRWTVTCQAPLSTEILQARKLEWVAVPSSRGSSNPRWNLCLLHWEEDYLPLALPGKPKERNTTPLKISLCACRQKPASRRHRPGAHAQEQNTRQQKDTSKVKL